MVTFVNGNVLRVAMRKPGVLALYAVSKTL
jgi:hypothetical protein